jgi:hypothetical protein
VRKTERKRECCPCEHELQLEPLGRGDPGVGDLKMLEYLVLVGRHSTGEEKKDKEE